MAQAAKQSKYIVDPHQVRSPTLLIGVGGIGGHIVHQVYNTMSKYDRTYVEMVVMDTNINDLEKFTGSGIHYIQTSENKTVQGYLDANGEYADWFPVNPLINAKNLSQGAGQIRSVSRLGALASKALGRFAPIDAAIDKILTNHGDPLVRAVRVMIVGSATGGTGSGLGVQLPFYVRNVLERKNVPNVLVRGLFLMPSLTEDKQDTDAKKKAVNVNGYAFLKEVNAFYHAQKTIAEDNVLSIEEYVPGVKTLTDGGVQLAASAPVPYEFLFLVEKNGTRGSIGGLEDYIERSAQIVMNQLFSPIAGHGFSTEDNLITSSVPTGGMNRYCGAGIANAIYPKDDVVRYCTVRYAGEMIKGYWLQIDDEFNRRDAQQRRQKKTNPSLDSLDRGDTFCKIFDEMCDPYKHEVSSEVSALKGELIVRSSRTEKNPTTGSDETIVEEFHLPEFMMDHIDEHLVDVFEKSGLSAERESCVVARSDLIDFPDDAADLVSKAMQKLRDFRTNADKTVSSLVVSTAEEILPSDLKLAQGITKDANYNVYVSLCKKHPIITRYALYSLRAKLLEKKREADETLATNSTRKETVFKKDYYKEKGETGDKVINRESPKEALEKTSPGLFAWAGFTSADYQKLANIIADDISAEAKHIVTMAESTLRATVYRIVLERLNVLIDLYEQFFEELREIVESKAEEAKRLEAGQGTGMDEDFKGDKYVCCNTQCKQFLYDQFQTSVTEAELEMSESVKLGFFDKMFQEYTTSLTEQANPTAYVTHLSLRQLFEQGVLEPITAQFQKKGFRHLDMSILEAIEKQFKIENQGSEILTNEKAFQQAFQQYFSDLCGRLRTLATPYLHYNLEVKNYRSGGKLAYSWGLNHSAVARYQSGSVEKGVDAQKLQSMFQPAEASLADDSFSPYQMVCYSSIYDLRIENCESYKVGTFPEMYYRERLQNLVDQSYEISDDPNGFLEVIHPHLDSRWHEHAYLPELMKYDDDALCRETRLAFMLSRCLNWCYHQEDKTEYLTCWWYQRTGDKYPSPIFVGGKELRSASIYSLYKAFDRNRAIVEDIQNRIAHARDVAYDSRPMNGITEKALLEQPIIQALIGKAGSKLNVLDLLYSLLTDSGNRKLLEENLADLEQYIYDYCFEMVNKNANKAAAMSAAVRKAIGEASTELKTQTTSVVFQKGCENFK